MNPSRVLFILLALALAAPLVACGGSEEENDNIVADGDGDGPADGDGDGPADGDGNGPADGDGDGPADGDGDGPADGDGDGPADGDGDGPADGDGTGDGDPPLPYTIHPINNPSFEDPVLEPGIAGQNVISSNDPDWQIGESFWFMYRPPAGEFAQSDPFPAPADGEQILAASMAWPSTSRLAGIGDAAITDSVAGEVIELSVAVLRPLTGEYVSEVGVAIITPDGIAAMNWMETVPAPGEIRELSVQFTVPDFLEGVPLFPAIYLINTVEDYRTAYFDNFEFRRYIELVDPAPTGLINGDFEDPVLHRETLFTQGAMGWRSLATSDYFGIRRPPADQLPGPMASGQNVLEMGFLPFSFGITTTFRTAGLIPPVEGKSYRLTATVGKRQDRSVPGNLVLGLSAIDNATGGTSWNSAGLPFNLNGANGTQWNELSYCVTPPAGTQGRIAIRINGMRQNSNSNPAIERIMISEVSLEEVDDCN